jgi:hypothetical protein
VKTHYNGPKMAIENLFKSPYPLYFELNEIELQIKKHLNYIEVKKKFPRPSP